MRAVLFALLLAAVTAAALYMIRNRRRAREELITQGGEPITAEALMADSGPSISP